MGVKREIWFATRNGMAGPVHWKGWALYASFPVATAAICAAGLVWMPAAILGGFILVGVYLVLLISHLDRS